MTFIFSFLAYLVTIPLFIVWLFFCAILALLGALLPKKYIAINLNAVKKKDTICSVLNNKGLLSDEKYSFETNDVAPLYDELTFLGYLFVLNPVIFLLKNVNFLDNLFIYLVSKWMKVHNFKKENNSKNRTFFSILAKVCVTLAGYVGQVLYRLKS